MRFIIFLLLSFPLLAKAQAGNIGDTSNEKPLEYAEIMPKFPGGIDSLMRFLGTEIKYPSFCRVNEIEGTSYIQFVVNAHGHVVDAKVIKKAHPLLDAEALRVINSMSDWTPGMQSGKKVSVYYTIPIRFKLDNPHEKVKGPKEKVYYELDSMPQFPGGRAAMDKYIVSHIKYPRYCKDHKIEGKVSVHFLVDAKGNVTWAKIPVPVQPQLDAEALRIVNHMPKWKPGEKDGQKVTVYYSVTVPFKIDQGK